MHCWMASSPFLRRVHPGPEVTDAERLRTFVQVAGHKMPKVLDHKSIQAAAGQRKCGKPESFMASTMVLKKSVAGRIFAGARGTLRWLWTLQQPVPAVCGFDDSSAARCVFRAGACGQAEEACRSGKYSELRRSGDARESHQL